jgi:endoglucanase
LFLAISLGCGGRTRSAGEGAGSGASRAGAPAGGTSTAGGAENGGAGVSFGGSAGSGAAGAGGALPVGFVHADGTRLVAGNGTPRLLRGVSLGNEVWQNVPVPDDHAEVDFARLAAMGANSTRFLLNYVMFEDDTAPFVYKPAGWDFVDQNVAWAKQYGIELILNMHVPEGGFQSNGEGGALWSDPKNQERLVALWTAIATRYRDEPAIAAYDFLNEPQPLTGRAEWQALAARILAAVRAVDPNHLVIVERTNAVNGDYGNDGDMNLFALEDANIAYEFHFYEPTEYAFQLQPWDQRPDGGVYPDDTKIAGVTEEWRDLASFDSPPAPVGNSDFTYFEGTRVAASSPDVVVGKPTLVGQALGAGTVTFDALSVKEFDPGGTYLREVMRIAPTSMAGWYFWSKDRSGSAGVTTSCEENPTCLTLTGSADDASLRGIGFYFATRPGYSYSLSGWMKGTDLPPLAHALLRIDLLGSATPVSARNKAGLRASMAPYLAWGASHAVPLFLGEFGAYKACFTADKGGLTWVGDVYDLAAGDGVSGAPSVAALSFHQYHEESFALYYGAGGPVDPANANQPLIDLLTGRFRGGP